MLITRSEISPPTIRMAKGRCESEGVMRFGEERGDRSADQIAVTRGEQAEAA